MAKTRGGSAAAISTESQRPQRAHAQEEGSSRARREEESRAPESEAQLPASVQVQGTSRIPLKFSGRRKERANRFPRARVCDPEPEGNKEEEPPVQASDHDSSTEEGRILPPRWGTKQRREFITKPIRSPLKKKSEIKKNVAIPAIPASSRSRAEPRRLIDESEDSEEEVPLVRKRKRVSPEDQEKRTEEEIQPVNAAMEAEPEVEVPHTFTGRNAAAKLKSLAKLPPAPLDNISFHFAECALKWNAVHKRPIWAERELSIEAQKLEEVMQLICHAGLEKTVSKFGPYYPMLVKECIVNLHTPFFTPDHEEYRTVFVRGRSFDFSVASINSYLGVTRVPQVKAVALNTIAKELTDGRRKTWPVKGTLPSADLSMKYAILLRIGLANWAPTSHSSSISKELALLIYQIGTRSPLNFAHFVLAHLEKHAKSCSPNLQLGFPSLITGILMDQCADIVRTNEEEGPRKGSLIISEKLFKGKHAPGIQKPTASKAKTVQATTLQAETIQEVEMEIMILDTTMELLAGRRMVLDSLLAKLKAAESAAPSASRPTEEAAAEDAEGQGVDEEEDNTAAESEKSAAF